MRKEIIIQDIIRLRASCFSAAKKSVVVLLCLFFGNGNVLSAQTRKEFPVPAGNTNQLFYLQRTENTNTVIYEVNEQNGRLNIESPIHIFWILYEKQKQHEELSDMERKFAYGIKIQPASNNQYQFTLVACPKITLELKKDAQQKYQVYVTPSKQQMILQKAYIQEKKSGLKLEPTVEYIEFTGKDVISGKEVIERITP